VNCLSFKSNCRERMSNDFSFEGMVLKKDRICRIWIDDCNMFCQYRDGSMLSKKFEESDWAQCIFKNFFFLNWGEFSDGFIEPT